MSRLPGSALPLPEIFREILRALYRSPCTGEMLCTVIRKQIPYKEERVLGIWESWEEFTGELTGSLEKAGLAVRDGDSWALTGKAVPGMQLAAVQEGDFRVRVTFHPQGDEIRTVLAEARGRTEDLISWLSARRGIDPALGRACDKTAGISEILAAALRGGPAGQDGRGRPRSDGSRVRGGQSGWYREWARTAGWHTLDRARLAWNEEHPDRLIPTTTECGFRGLITQMRDRRQMETRPARRSDGKEGGLQYLWTG